MIKKLAKISATASYSFGKLSPFSGGITVTGVTSMYLVQATGMPILTATVVAFGVLITAFCLMMAFAHFSGLLKAEQEYLVGELGMGEKK